MAGFFRPFQSLESEVKALLYRITTYCLPFLNVFMNLLAGYTGIWAL
jgi:hypothetical protein